MEENPPSVAADTIPTSAEGLNRQPQPLSRNFEQRVKQLTVIAEHPTDQQIKKFADQIAFDNPKDAERATEMAVNSFNNVGSLIKERADADMAVRQARREALSAPSNEFKAKVALLREAEQKRAEVTLTLKTFGNAFQEAGVELDPSQIPLSVGEKMGQKAHEARDSMIAGVGRAQEGIKGTTNRLGHKAQEIGGKVVSGANWMKESTQGAAGYVVGEVGAKIETAKEAGARLMEAGRGGLRKLIEVSISSLNQAQEATQVGFNDVKSMAEVTAGRTTGGLSKLAEIWRNAKESTAQRVSNTWEAASVWANQRRQEIASQVASVQENVDQMLARARTSAGSRIDGFNQAMRSVGEAARANWDGVSESVKNFASEQAKRVEDISVQTSSRVKAEVSMALEKGKIFLEPAWESVQRDRERIRQEGDVYGEKLGIMVEGASDIASPIIDRILDEGRDLRDAALGFGSKQIQGLQVFGRNVAGETVEVSSSAWNFLVERWENLRLRANESRIRLNTFMEAVSGKTGNRFSMLKESASERAKRTSSMLSGVKIEGGRVLQNGVEVSKEVAEWFVQTGTTAKEFLINRKEQIDQGINMLQRYWEVYAVGKWKESGLTDLDIKRRMQLLRATGAASLGRAASIGAAAGIEGMGALLSLARDPRGRVALTVMFLGIALAAANPEMRDGIQSLLSNVDLSGFHLPNLGGIQVPDLSGVHLPGLGGIHVPDLGSHLAGTDASSAVSMPHVVGVPIHVAPVDTSAAVGITPGHPITSPDVIQGVPTTPDASGAISHMTAPDTSAAVGITPGHPMPHPADIVHSPHVAEAVVSAPPSPNMLTPGQPLEAQARQLAGGVNENYYHLLQGGFNQFRDNFLSSAREIVNNPTHYSPEQVSLARQQLEAATRLSQDPTLVEGSKGWYDTIMKATHFWR